MLYYGLVFLGGMVFIPTCKALVELIAALRVFWRHLDYYHPDAYDFSSRNNYQTLPILGRVIVRTMLVFKRVEPMDCSRDDVDD